MTLEEKIEKIEEAKKDFPPELHYILDQIQLSLEKSQQSNNNVIIDTPADILNRSPYSIRKQIRNALEKKGVII